jgi:hypothetical protein
MRQRRRGQIGRLPARQSARARSGGGVACVELSPGLSPLQAFVRDLPGFHEQGCRGRVSKSRLRCLYLHSGEGDRFPAVTEPNEASFRSLQHLLIEHFDAVSDQAAGSGSSSVIWDRPVPSAKWLRRRMELGHPAFDSGHRFACGLFASANHFICVCESVPSNGSDFRSDDDVRSIATVPNRSRLHNLEAAVDDVEDIRPRGFPSR